MKPSELKKSDIKWMPAYFDRYIALAEDVSIIEALRVSLKELEEAPIQIWKDLDKKVYAEGKWTINDILQHMIDTERVFVYRITAIARGEQQALLPYDEDEYAKNTTANQRITNDLLDELILIRRATLMMYSSFSEEMLHHEGKGFNGMRYAPLALGFMLAGHQRWHFRVMEEKYYPLLKTEHRQ